MNSKIIFDPKNECLKLNDIRCSFNPENVHQTDFDLKGIKPSRRGGDLGLYSQLELHKCTYETKLIIIDVFNFQSLKFMCNKPIMRFSRIEINKQSCEPIIIVPQVVLHVCFVPSVYEFKDLFVHNSFFFFDILFESFDIV